MSLVLGGGGGGAGADSVASGVAGDDSTLDIAAVMKAFASAGAKKVGLSFRWVGSGKLMRSVWWAGQRRGTRRRTGARDASLAGCKQLGKAHRD